MKDCRVCGTPSDKKPMIFRGEDWCCDGHRKVVKGEVKPTQAEWSTMDSGLQQELTRAEYRERNEKYPVSLEISDRFEPR